MISGRDRVAAGPAAVAESARQVVKHLGVRRAGLTLKAVNQPEGFDCPGCAWPEPAPGERRHLEFCENGVKAIAEEATRDRIRASFFAEHSVEDLSGRENFWLSQQGRLTEPMIRRPGDTHFRPIGWEKALQLVATTLGDLASPDEAVFYTSGRASNEAAWCWALFARLFGTNNLPDCSNLCHESSGRALGASIGVGKGTVAITDFAKADLIVLAGQNPGTNHPRMLTTLAEARRAGAEIVSVNPLPEAGLVGVADPQRPTSWLGGSDDLSAELLQVRLGGDLALWQLVGRLVVESGRLDALDKAFIANRTEGFEEWAAHAARVEWESALAACGLTRTQVQRFADRILTAENIIVCWAMGLTQHTQAVDTIREVTNVILARGSIGRPGAGLCPVRGHSNVQGDRTMGVWERPPEAFLARFDSHLGTTLPRNHGLDVVDSIEAMERGEIKVFCALGGNFAKASPDTGRTEAAIDQVELNVQLSTKLNHTHLRGGGTTLILPVLGRTEIDAQATGPQFVTVEDSMSSVHASRGVLEPASRSLRSEVAVVTELAERCLGPSPVDWASLRDDYRRIRALIEATIDGFDDFEAKVAREGGFVLANSVRDERSFSTDDGLAHFSVIERNDIEVPDGALLLQTLRSHDQYNTTVYGFDDRYRGVKGTRKVILLHEADMVDRGLSDGDLVDVETIWDDDVERRVDRFRATRYDTPRGCAAAYFPETNPLVPLGAVAEGSNTPVFKAIPVRISPSR